jgi:hypothetical protein
LSSFTLRGKSNTRVTIASHFQSQEIQPDVYVEIKSTKGASSPLANAVETALSESSASHNQ